MAKATLKLPLHLKPSFDDPDRFQEVVAHRRWGKTLRNVAKCVAGTKHHVGAIKKPDTLYWIVYPTYKQAKLSAWKMLKSISSKVDPRRKANETELSVKLFNGSEIHLKGADRPDLLKGAGLDGACMDEWALHAYPEVWSEVIRPMLADPNRLGWGDKTFTPKGQNHAYSDFENGSKKHFYPADQTGVIPADELAQIRREVSADEYAQEFLCQFLYYAGQIYTEIDKYDVIVPMEKAPIISEHWKRLVGIDWGMTNMTAIPFSAVDYDGRIWIYDEYDNVDKYVDHYAPIILQRTQGVESEYFIDPETKSKDQFRNGVRYSIYQEFIDQGVPVQLANNNVIAGINKVKQMMASGQLKILARCEKTIEQLKGYQWRKKAGKDANEPDRPMKVRDHYCDSVRYICATYFDASDRPKPPIVKYSLDWFDAAEKKQARAAGREFAIA